jgi:hypothetical protein
MTRSRAQEPPATARGTHAESFMLRARQTGSTSHQLVGHDRLVNRRLHAITLEHRERAEDYARRLLKENAGADGLDSVQVIPAFPQGAKPVVVITATDMSTDDKPGT